MKLGFFCANYVVACMHSLLAEVTRCRRCRRAVVGFGGDGGWGGNYCQTNHCFVWLVLSLCCRRRCLLLWWWWQRGNATNGQVLCALGQSAVLWRDEDVSRRGVVVSRSSSGHAGIPFTIKRARMTSSGLQSECTPSTLHCLLSCVGHGWQSLVLL